MRYHLTSFRIATIYLKERERESEGGGRKWQAMVSLQRHEPLSTVGGSIKWCSCYAKQYRGPSTKLNTELPYDLAARFQVYIQTN